jgi:hypothetical protein
MDLQELHDKIMDMIHEAEDNSSYTDFMDFLSQLDDDIQDMFD